MDILKKVDVNPFTKGHLQETLNYYTRLQDPVDRMSIKSVCPNVGAKLLVQIRSKVLAEYLAPTDLHFNRLHIIKVDVSQLRHCPVYIQYIFGQFLESWRLLEVGDRINFEKVFITANRLFNLYMFMETNLAKG